MWMPLAVTVALLWADVFPDTTMSTLTYEAFSLGGAEGRQLIARGVRRYSPCDIESTPTEASGTDFAKTLALDGGFGISTTVKREARLTGFGLVVVRPGDDNGFGWDWFDLESGRIFRKLQGNGRVAVGIATESGYENLQSVEFLDDVTLRYLDDMSKPPGTHTHEIVVGKGSVLKLDGPETLGESPCPTGLQATGSPSADRPARLTAPAPVAEEADTWLTYYYLKPRPELALGSLDLIDKRLRAQGRSLAQEATRGGMRSFYARLFEANDAVVAEVAARFASSPAGHQTFLREALRRCGTPACARIAGTGRDAAIETRAAASANPSTLDDAWASFFATGDAKYVHVVIEVLPWSEARGDVDRMLTGGAARWSLASNAYQHGRVLAIAEDAARTAPAETKTLLQQIIDQAKASRLKNPPPERR
jgi:hypothetical protein